MEQKQTKKLILIISCILVVLIAASAAAYAIWKDSLTPKGDDTSNSPTSSTISEVKMGKLISVVVVTEGKEFKFEYETEAEFLREALEDKELIKGDESEYGLFVTEVYGIKADASLRQWWKFSKNGQELLTGVDTTPVSNGDTIEIALSTY